MDNATLKLENERRNREMIVNRLLANLFSNCDPMWTSWINLTTADRSAILDDLKATLEELLVGIEQRAEFKASQEPTLKQAFEAGLNGIPEFPHGTISSDDPRQNY